MFCLGRSMLSSSLSSLRSLREEVRTPTLGLSMLAAVFYWPGTITSFFKTRSSIPKSLIAFHGLSGRVTIFLISRFFQALKKTRKAVGLLRLRRRTCKEDGPMAWAILLHLLLTKKAFALSLQLP